MKFFLCAVGIYAATVMMATHANAQNYPWCAEYGGNDTGGGGTNCGFISFEQCMETLRGMGGFCNRNTQYVPPPGPHPAPAHRSRWPR